MLKKLIMNTSHDSLLYNLQGGAFVVAIIAILLLFPLKALVPFLFMPTLIVFGVSTLFGILIGIIWLLRDFMQFEDFYRQLHKKSDHSENEKEVDLKNEKDDQK